MYKHFELDPWVICKEYRLDDGSIEIGVYVVGEPEVMVGVITHPAGGRKWFWHGPDYSRKAFYTRRVALDHALETACDLPAFQALNEELWNYEKQFDYGWENIAANH